jgi:outer membrane protein OmpA-like peptidoglycan-associated protein
MKKELSMDSYNARRLGIVVLGALVALSTIGCATKKMVRQNVQQMDTKLANENKMMTQKTSENAEDIKSVDARAESGIAKAQNSADNAGQQAAKAGQDAQSANTLAQRGVDQAAKVQQTVESLDNPQPVKTATVLFAFNKSTLNSDAKSQLDGLQQTVSGLKYYTVNVTGYTDKTGPVDYNLQLSRQRADAVVRYLTENNKIPLEKIHELGYGRDMPKDDNKTREGRKENRRVDVTILAPQTQTGSASPSQPTQPSGSR